MIFDEPRTDPLPVVRQERACLIRCPPEACGADACCPPPGMGQLVDVDGEETAITSESA